MSLTCIPRLVLSIRPGITYCYSYCFVCSYLATWHYPVSDGEKRQPNSDPEYCPALHSNGLLPQTREVLVPDSEQLLLTIGMSDKLGGKKHRDEEHKSSEEYVEEAKGRGHEGWKD